MTDEQAPIVEIGNPTKIVVTVGPATDDADVMSQVIDEGVDLIRLNFSHGDHAAHERRYRQVRNLQRQAQNHIGIIADLQGPKIRTGKLADGKSVLLHEGDSVTITAADDEAGTGRRITTDYAELADDVHAGDTILIDDGLLELRVLETGEGEVKCEVVTGGQLGERKGINLPGITVSAPALSKKDREDLRFAIGLGVDYIALSFVRSATDVAIARDAIGALDADLPIIAKLEKPEAIDDLQDIIEASDAVMVARGDLGVEMPPEEVPVVQKKIIRECSARRVPVITATQMLESMCEHPRPTRAEASDIANAILDGTDAVMLSGETAVGEYPVKSIEMMRRIAEVSEQELFKGPHLRLQSQRSQSLSFSDALSRAAAQVAENLEAKIIVAFTQSGLTARLASQCRPRVPILAATPVTATARRCSLYWGVRPIIVEQAEDTDAMVANVSQKVRDMGFAETGEVIVVTAGTPVGQWGTTNMIRLEVLD